MSAVITISLIKDNVPLTLSCPKDSLRTCLALIPTLSLLPMSKTKNDARVKNDSPPISISMIITIFPNTLNVIPGLATTESPVPDIDVVAINRASIKLSPDKSDLVEKGSHNNKAPINLTAANDSIIKKYGLTLTFFISRYIIIQKI